MQTPTIRPGDGVTRALRIASCLLLTATTLSAQAAVDPTDRAERWWDASRADRISFSDGAARSCKSVNCDSLQIRSCLNDTLKPPTAAALRAKTIGEVTATCIAGLSTKK